MLVVCWVSNVLTGEEAAGLESSGKADLGSANCLAILHACSSSSASASLTSRPRSRTGDDWPYDDDGRRWPGNTREGAAVDPATTL